MEIKLKNGKVWNSKKCLPLQCIKYIIYGISIYILFLLFYILCVESNMLITW